MSNLNRRLRKLNPLKLSRLQRHEPGRGHRVERRARSRRLEGLVSGGVPSPIAPSIRAPVVAATCNGRRARGGPRRAAGARAAHDGLGLGHLVAHRERRLAPEPALSISLREVGAMVVPITAADSGSGRRPARLRLDFVLAVRCPTAPLGRDLAYPSWRPASPRSPGSGQSLDTQNRLFNAIAFLAQFR